jgi:phosphoadenosine phosphosulfate reductase
VAGAPDDRGVHAVAIIRAEQMHISGSTRQQRLYDASIDLLRLACPPEGYYLATSFGKDSIVAHRLCDEAGVKYDAHHNVTGIDPPELVYFGRKHYPDVERHMPGISMWRLIEKNGMPPLRRARYCCETLKEYGGQGRICVMGMRAEESARRAKGWAPLAEYGGARKRLFDHEDIAREVQACSSKSKFVVSPLFQWNDTDIWDFICDRRMPYCELYDQGFDRLGCIGCPMAKRCEREAQFKRNPAFRAAYVRAFQRLLDAGKFSNRNWTTGEQMMEWWLDDRTHDKPLAGQETMDLEDV